MTSKPAVDDLGLGVSPVGAKMSASPTRRSLSAIQRSSIPEALTPWSRTQLTNGSKLVEVCVHCGTGFSKSSFSKLFTLPRDAVSWETSEEISEAVNQKGCCDSGSLLVLCVEVVTVGNCPKNR
ncbi:unnamed protein product [Amoebophrya sp. A25]|nr:unnamed protein product [Amoebophrya sp. A25]|eukprot:GSA25T00027389001.1